MELEGHEVAVEAQVECEPPPDTWCYIKCRPHQVQTTGAWVGMDALATGRLITSAGCSACHSPSFDTGKQMDTPNCAIYLMGSPYPSLTKLISQGVL